MSSSVGQDQLGEAFLFFVDFSVLMVLLTSLFTSQSMLRSRLTIFLCGVAELVQSSRCCSRLMSVPPSPPSSAGVEVNFFISSIRGRLSGRWLWRLCMMPRCCPARFLHILCCSALFPSLMASSSASSCSCCQRSWFLLFSVLICFWMVRS